MFAILWCDAIHVKQSENSRPKEFKKLKNPKRGLWRSRKTRHLLYQQSLHQQSFVLVNRDFAWIVSLAPKAPGFSLTKTSLL